MNSLGVKNYQRWNSTFHLYLMCTTVFGVSLFLFGFFPIKNTVLTSNSEPFGSFENKETFSYNWTSSRPIIGHLVFMVIDAMRADFISGQNTETNMPYLSNLVHSGEACTFTAVANPPTVTMPRIKAMVTGTVPGFVDVVLNLGSPRLVEESFVSNLVSSGKQAVFYGDDTWLRMFPNTFTRSEGTTSFFVADYTEVDVNVTRHLPRELASKDWDLLVLHYLGLDHIGHLVGPRSSLVGPKLREMDDVIKQIHQAKSEEGLPQLLLVCGDHGMKDSGSHGGASEAETRVAVAAVGLPCHSSKSNIAQVDLAPTLSVLLGLPVPAGSIGTLVPELMATLDPQHHLEALYKNTAHLAALLGSSVSAKQESLLVEATRLHTKWMEHFSEDLFERVKVLYESAATDMSSALAQAHTSFDVYALAVSSSVIFQCLIILSLSVIQETKAILKVGRTFLLFIFYIGLNALLCSFICEVKSIMCSIQPGGLLLQAIIAFMLSYNTNLLIESINKNIIKFPSCGIERFLLAGTIMHSLGFGASSLVEEEHQVWYFLWTTLLVILLHRGSLWLIVASLIMHRMSRKWNQTGDKWAALPDLEDWLAERKDMTTLVFLVGLVAMGFYLFKCSKKSIASRIIYASALLFIYLYRAAIGAVELPYFELHLSHQGWIEARIFGACLLAILTKGLAVAVNKRSPLTAATTLRDCWILGAAMLRRPHDIILLPAQLLASHVLAKMLHSKTVGLATAQVWLGWTAYFYQGNSNSLASIDVAAGYVGLLDYQPGIVGLFLLAHTYSAPVLSQLLLLCSLLQTSSVMEAERGLRVCSLLRVLPVCMYLFVAALQREHLFVWSVFAPKLLYEATATLVALLTLLPCLACIRCSRGRIKINVK